MSEFQWVRTRPGQLPQSEGWGARRAARAVGMTTADCRRVRTKMGGWQRCGRLNPPRSRCECPGVLGPHRTAREPITSVATGRCETREFANNNRSKGIVTGRTACLHAIAARQHCILPHQSSLPGVARLPDVSCPLAARQSPADQ